MNWRLIYCSRHPLDSARIHEPLPILLAPGSLELFVIGRDVLD